MSRDDDRMVDVAENHGHVAEQRIDDEARDEQQQRIDTNRHHRAVNSHWGCGRGNG